MASFRSNEELFEAVSDLMAKLEIGGHHQAVAELKEGLGCLNGLTDGWALFLEAIERVQATESKRFSREDQKALKTIRATVHAIVYRR